MNFGREIVSVSAVALLTAFASTSFSFPQSGLVPRDGTMQTALHVEKIVLGGQQVNPRDLIRRSTVMILRYSASQKLKEICSGVIIDSDLVLTAAHCAAAGDQNTSEIRKVTQTERLAIYYGDFDVDHMDNAQLNSVVAISIHPRAEIITAGGAIANDFAILKVAQTHPTFYQPMAILGDEAKLELGTQVKIVGQGTYDPAFQSFADVGVVKEYDNLSISSKKGCNYPGGIALEVKSTDSTISYQGQFLGVLMTEHIHQGSFRGDSGGAAYIEKSGVQYLIGVSQSSVYDNSVQCYSDIRRVRRWISDTSIQMSNLR